MPEVAVESGDGTAAVRTRPETKIGYNTFGQATDAVDLADRRRARRSTSSAA